MASSIQDQHPANGATLASQPIRQNFVAAKSEIEALQSRPGTASNPLPLSDGGTGTSAASTTALRTHIGAGTGNGTVTNVTGTANQIQVQNGTTTPTLSLLAPAAGGTTHGGSGQMVTTMVVDSYGRVTSVTAATASGGSGGEWNGGTVTQPVTIHPASVVADFSMLWRGTAEPGSGDVLGNVFFRAGVAPTTNAGGAAIIAQTTATWSSTSRPCRLQFSVTAPNATAALPRMIINEHGAVSVGNLNPATVGANNARGSFNCERLFINGVDVTDAIMGLL